MTNFSDSHQPENVLPVSAKLSSDCLRAEFNKKYKTEDDCWGEIYRVAKEAGSLECRHCDKTTLSRISRTRWLKCPKCKNLTSLTAKTLFHGIRLARPWLAAIWFMEHGEVLSSVQLHKYVGIAQSSALHILRKLTTAIRENMNGSLELPSNLFYDVLCRRSRETPARRHPKAEQDEINDTSESIAQTGPTQAPANAQMESEPLDRDLLIDSVRMQAMMAPPELVPSREAAEGQPPGVTDFSASTDTQNKILECLSEGPIREDLLCCRTGMGAGELAAPLLFLELAGTITSNPGNIYALSSSKPNCETASEIPVELKVLVASIGAFIRFNFHGISRKYLQNYLAAYWCQVARSRWCEGSIIKLCLHFHPVSYNDILDYVSPINVKISNYN